jgi:hypothetical protein
VEGAVYLLCAAAALGCALLLWRGYRRSRVGLLFWSAACFLALALENLVLFVDLILVPQADLSAVWLGLGLIGVAALLYGLVWDHK